LGVCYEADFLHELVAINSTTDWWLIVSDDGWFYPSWMAEQHWQIVRLHAIALGRDIARVTNLGITGVAQANGANQIVANPIDVMEAKIVKVQSYQGDTFYGQWQDMPILGIISFILALALMRQKRRIV
jgi:apolipoprotein N-acyltransferase